MNSTEVTLFRGGRKQKTVAISDVEIPDLWHTTEALWGGLFLSNDTKGKDAAIAQILECWHICGALKKHIEDTPEILRQRDKLLEALRELRAVVLGECPSLLNEDSGGDAELAIEIENAIAECEEK